MLCWYMGKVGPWHRAWGWLLLIADVCAMNNSTVTGFKVPMRHHWVASHPCKPMWAGSRVPHAMWPCSNNLRLSFMVLKMGVSVSPRLGLLGKLNVTIYENAKHSAWYTAVNDTYSPFLWKIIEFWKPKRVSSRFCW